MERKKCTLITGACGGLGRAFVKILAEEKENLILTGTSKAKLDSLLEDFKEEFKDVFVKTAICDLSIRKQREDLIKEIKDSGMNILQVPVEGNWELKPNAWIFPYWPYQRVNNERKKYWIHTDNKKQYYSWSCY